MNFIFLIFPFLVLIGLFVAQAIRRGFHMKELVEHGRETTGTVSKKYSFYSSSRKNRYIRYSYRDDLGKQHSHKVTVSREDWEKYDEGDPIEVVYSEKNRHISALRPLIETCRDIVNKKTPANRVKRS